MRKLIGVFIVLIILAVAFVFGTPYLMGYILEGQYKLMVDTLARATNTKIEVAKFQRGWFDSSATLQVSFKSRWLKDKKSTQTTAVLVKQKIKHGVLIFARRAEDKKLDWIFAKALINTQSSSPNFQFKASTLWGLSDNLTTTIGSPNISLSDAQTKLTFKNLAGTVDYNANNKKIESHFAVASGTIANKTADSSNTAHAMKIEFEDMLVKSSFNESGALWYGDRTISFDKLQVDGHDGKSLAMKGLKLVSKVKDNNGSTNINLKLSASKVKNSQFDFSDFNLGFAVDNLNTKALTELIQATQEMPPQAPHDPKFILQLTTPFFNMIGKGLTLSLSQFEVTAESGKISATGQLQVPAQQGQINLTNLVQYLKGELKIEVPQAWFTDQLVKSHLRRLAVQQQSTMLAQQSAKRDIDYWVANSMLVPAGSSWLINITFNKGKLLVNGKPPALNPPQLTTPTQSAPVAPGVGATTMPGTTAPTAPGAGTTTTPSTTAPTAPSNGATTTPSTTAPTAPSNDTATVPPTDNQQ